MTPVAIDISHHNTVISWAAIKAAGIQGVIHKSTQGTRYVDPDHDKRRAEALKYGLLWGAYHFSTNAPPHEQVAHFLRNAKPDDDTLLALDWEHNPDGPDMSVGQAREFLKALMQATNRQPKDIVVYGGNVLKENIRTPEDIAFFSQFRLWLCQYGPTAKLPKAWPKYWAWQYSEKGLLDGMDPKGHVDLNVYSGPDLASEWGVVKPAAPVIPVIDAHDDVAEPEPEQPEVRVSAPPVSAAASAPEAPTTASLAHLQAHDELNLTSWLYSVHSGLLKMIRVGTATGTGGLFISAQTDPVGTASAVIDFCKQSGWQIAAGIFGLVVVLELFRFVMRQMAINKKAAVPA